MGMIFATICRTKANILRIETKPIIYKIWKLITLMSLGILSHYESNILKYYKMRLLLLVFVKANNSEKEWSYLKIKF